MTVEPLLQLLCGPNIVLAPANASQISPSTNISFNVYFHMWKKRPLTPLHIWPLSLSTGIPTWDFYQYLDPLDQWLFQHLFSHVKNRLTPPQLIWPKMFSTCIFTCDQSLYNSSSCLFYFCKMTHYLKHTLHDPISYVAQYFLSSSPLRIGFFIYVYSDFTLKF